MFYITLSNKLHDSNFNYERFDHSYCTDVLATYVCKLQKSVSIKLYFNNAAWKVFLELLFLGNSAGLSTKAGSQPKPLAS